MRSQEQHDVLPAADGDAIVGPLDRIRIATAPPARAIRLRIDPGEHQGTRAPRSRFVYVQHALMHPWHIVVLAGAIVIGVAHWSIATLFFAFGGAELLLFGVVLRLRCFRRYVDERLEYAERERAAERRGALLRQMGDDHRSELVRLEAVVDKIRDATQGRLPLGVAGASLAADECLRLLASFVRLAIAYNVSRECLASVDRAMLGAEIQRLERTLPSQEASSRTLGEQRVVVGRRRLERWDRSRAALESIGQQLAIIADLVRLTHEQVSAPAESCFDAREVTHAVRELDDSQATLDELSEYLGVRETVDPQTLAMGRRATAASSTSI